MSVPTPTTTTSSSSQSTRSPTKRILTELSNYAAAPSPSIPSLAPTSASNIFHLSCILSGHTLPASSPYHSGRWLLSITLPPNYPLGPPLITFQTKICHPNISWETGEVCLDVLKENWTPVLGVVGAVECVGRLLGEPGTDSPLAIEVAGLVRGGDKIGEWGLVRFWCGEERWEGGLLGEEGAGEKPGRS